ncbi:MAG: ornithine cyclodeaminase family protein [Proteobacteria bacterium]|nr:ornithine cyclodeaminase family protein [Pseudomonadota bacterium]
MSIVPSRKALYITGSDVPRLLTMSDAIRVVEDAFRARASGGAADHARYRMRTPEAAAASPSAESGSPAVNPAGKAAGRAMMHVLGGTLSAHGVLGTKTYVTTPSGAQFVVLLFSVEGHLLAVIEANVLGQIRTGAASGVATKHLALPDASVMAVIGAGFQARAQVEAVCAVRSIREVRVFSRTPARVDRFVGAMRFAIEAEVRGVDSIETAVEGADVICTATTSVSPVLTCTHLRPGVHVNAMGSNAPTRRELDESAVLAADLIVVDDLLQAQAEAGDLIAVANAGRLAWSDVTALADVVSGRVRRADARAVTLFESQGLATEDLAVARHVYEGATRAGLGIALPLSE